MKPCQWTDVLENEMQTCEMVPVISEVVGDVDVHPISPIGLEERTRKRPIEDLHVLGKPIWRQCGVLKTQPILQINF